VTITYKGEINLGQARNSLGVRTYTRQFRLTTSLNTEREYNVGSHASLPQIGSVHPSDSAAYCVGLSVDHTEPRWGWTVTAEYTTQFERATNPTNDPAQISWSSEQFQRVMAQDKDGDAVMNSAGDFFDPPVMIDDSRRVATVKKNLAAVPTWLLDYQDAVNNDAFSIDGVSIAIGQAKMQTVSVDVEQERNGVTFRPVTFTIQFQRDLWTVKVLDAGFRDINGDRITSDDGTDVTQPAPLNGSGLALANPTPATAQFITFDAYKERAFSSLPLT